MSKNVVVEISPDGKVTVHVEGVPGPTCVPLARQVAGLLGVAGAEEHTEEFWLLEGLPPAEAARCIGRGLTEGWVTPDEAHALAERLGLSVETLAVVLAGNDVEAAPSGMEAERASGGSSD